MPRLAALAALVLVTTRAAAEPPPEPRGMELAAAAGATAGLVQGEAAGVGAGASLAFSGTGVWALGGRIGALWLARDASTPGGSFRDAHDRLLQFHVVVRRRVERLTLAFGAGIDSRATSRTRIDDGTSEPYRSSTYFFGASADVSYTLARSGSHLFELTAGASLSPLFDVIAALDSGELTANARVFAATVGLGYRYR
ncbi:MAG: hypothetical protein KF773_15010 [Deltaproteobacteria bacterium]|nr:hypothetical protein [Deltaproteobacteria bacterium]